MATIKFGYGNEVKKSISTLDQVRDDEALQAVLGYGDNVDFYVNGVKVPDGEERELVDGDVVSIQTRTSTKA